MMRKNIVLIGMTGCGKTTIGKLLAKELEMDFKDMDEIIENEEGRKIRDIFEENGEDFFREKETDCAKEVSALCNTVISTGGGIVLREENMAFLKNNSVVIYLKRSINSIKETIDASKRPLLDDGLDKLSEMKEKRGPLYEKYADFIVENEKSKEEIVSEILKYL